MEDYITLTEIYVYNPKLFKIKNLKSFVKNHKIQESDMVLKGAKILGIKKKWIQKNIPSFDLKLEEFNNNDGFFEVIPTLEQYLPKIKTFNPITLNLDSTTVKYFAKKGQRVPYFTKKGYIKIKILYNDFNHNGYDWMYELINGSLQSQLDNLENVKEMVNLKHPPIVKNIDENMVLSNRIYDLDKNDIIVDFKRIADLKKEPNLKRIIKDYECPLYLQLQTNFNKGLKEAEDNFNIRLKELAHERVVQHLKQELDKEKCLKDQALSLTQSFIPMSIINGEIKPSPSPLKTDDKNNHKLTSLSSFGKLKPSKIQ